MTTLQQLRDAELARRIASPGVFRSKGFNSAAEFPEPHSILTAKGSTVWGDSPNQLANGTYLLRANPNTGNVNWPFIDNNEFLSGSGSLCFEVPSQSSQDGGGNAIISFGDGVLFGAPVESQQHSAGNEFYVQWQQKISLEMLTTAYWQGLMDPVTKLFTVPKYDKYGHLICSAIKHCILSSGDLPPGWSTKYPNGKAAGYCTKTELVLDRNSSSWAPILYHECGAYKGMYLGWPTASKAYNVQNAWPNDRAEVYPGTPGSQYALTHATDHSDYIGPVPGAWNYGAEPEYMTFQIGVGGLGERRWCDGDPRFNTANVSRWRFWDSWVRVWATHENGPTHLIVDWSPGSSPAYFPLCCGENAIDGDQHWYGKIAFNPFMTDKNPTQVHAPARVWYDNVIFSTQRIPDPLPITQSDPLPEIIMPTPQQQTVLDDAEKTLNDACAEAGVALTSIPSVAAAISSAVSSVQAQLDAANASLSAANTKITAALADAQKVVTDLS